MREAIILAGGEGWRLKPATWVPKPLLKINKRTLIDHQIEWLRSHGFENIIVASNRSDITKLSVNYSLEEENLGTGGATKKAFEQVKGKVAYVMNVDDLVFYDPNELFDYAGKGAGLLLSKPQIPFGKVTLANGIDVIRFQQRMTLDFYVSAGHYVFKRNVVESMFPDNGDFEFTAMQRLADKKMLQGYTYHGMWFTLNTMNDLHNVRNFFKE
ncbi:MAG: sugar phosphate nucleotidyltransferase [Candidatus Bathyarchaeota archaeon]|nr:sugar phosphate nucleotidyltransferase [Candidatus Bathyarchaeota archaeon]